MMYKFESAGFLFLYASLATMCCSMGWKSKDGSVSFTSRVHQNGQIELSLVAASVKGPRSWLGIGVSKSGGMADADIVIGILNNDAKDIGSYWSAGKTRPEFLQSLAGGVLERLEDGALKLSFNRSLDSNTDDARSLPIETSGMHATNFIYAMGEVSESNAIRYHYKKGAFSIVYPARHDDSDYVNGADGEEGRMAQTEEEDDIDTPSQALVKAHAILMIIGWCALVPFGIIMARFGKEMFPNWYIIHRNCQLFGVTCILASTALIMYDQQMKIQIDSVHHMLGLAIIVAMVLEVALGFISNALWKPGKRPHVLHDKLHWWMGRVTFAGAFVNIAVGCYFYMSSRHVLLAIQFAWLIVISVAFAILNMTIGQKHEADAIAYEMKKDCGAEDHEEETLGTTAAVKGMVMTAAPKKGSGWAAIVFFTISGFILIAWIGLLIMGEQSYEFA